ncbi:hypothetical protein OSB04_024547 [Centaurea solstitialis]|uniref:No apical meristem-associated C-terminal domain-containing protein n=1 Tax=Centaurea solstitialis TaxID=347529 RepID=A0AA38SYM7_9ASTR|nr:hypothetical protein OSB04_024547 [Centaurea solstitialis]
MLEKYQDYSQIDFGDEIRSWEIGSFSLVNRRIVVKFGQRLHDSFFFNLTGGIEHRRLQHIRRGPREDSESYSGKDRVARGKEKVRVQGWIRARPRCDASGEMAPTVLGKNPTTGRSKCKPWKADEEVELSKAWAETSEDPNIGNYQNGDAFWKTMKASFDIRMGFGPDHRSVDAIMSENDTNVLQKARYRYREEVHKTFPHEHVWNILKDCPKFKPIEILGPSNVHAPKRSKTFETASPASSDSVMALLEQLTMYNASSHSYLETMRRNAEVREARQKSTNLAYVAWTSYGRCFDDGVARKYG